MATAALRPALLTGRILALLGTPTAELSRLLSELGARMVSPGEGQAPHALVLDHSRTVGDGVTVLLEELWPPLLELAGGMIRAGGPGKVVLVAPRSGSGPHAEALRAALENLARTLSVEWARYQLTSVTLLPGAATSDAELATLVAFLVSEAGSYFSGCRFELGATRTGHPAPPAAQAH